MVYDRTARGPGPLPGLGATWWTGARLYRALGRLDGWCGAASWPEALGWLAAIRPGRPIAEIQFWGHGKWGCAMIDRRPLDASALDPAHPAHPALSRIRARMVGPEALWWFRTCETFGAHPGHAFARAWTRFFGCRAAGHTYVIHLAQSGLHSLAPGAEPGWSLDEGLPPGTEPGALPAKAMWSTLSAPNTITCFHGRVPDGF